MKRTFALVMAAGLALAACSTSGGDSSIEEAAASQPGDALFGGATSEVDLPETADAAIDFDADRKVIRTAGLELRADDTRAEYDRITRLVRSIGGFVASATVYPAAGEGAQPQVAMTLRVPADDLDATLDAIKESADEVVSETQHADDVSDQFIDLDARITNLQALEVELRALLTEMRAKADADPDKLIRIFDEVSSVRGQIEQLQGQLDHLSDQAVLATVDIGITQTPSTAPLVDDPWDPGASARSAFSNLVSGLQTMADWAISFAIYALPLLVIVGGPLALVAWLIFRRLARRPQPGVTPTPTNT